MARLKVVVVGGGVAGLVAADSSRGADDEASITVLSEEPHLPYRRPALPLVVKGCVPSLAAITMFDRKALWLRRIKYLSGTRAVSVDLRGGSVKAVKWSGREVRVQFDRLILATGGRPIKPGIKGSDKPGVYVLRKFEDAQTLSRAARPGRRAVIVGAGFVGLIVSEALSRRGMKVRLVELRSHILPDLFEPDLAARIQRRVISSGIEVMTGTTIDKISGGERVESVRIAGEDLKASMVVLTTGVGPDVGLAESIGAAVGRRGVVVDCHMQTSCPGVYAAGDCVEVFDLVTGGRIYLPVGSVAAEGGEVAGLNSVGREVAVRGFLRAQDERVFDLDLVSIGLTGRKAGEAGIRTSVVDLAEVGDHGRGSWADVRVMLDSRSRVVGAQMIGSRLNRRKVNALLTSVRAGAGFDELQGLWSRRFLTVHDLLESRVASGTVPS